MVLPSGNCRIHSVFTVAVNGAFGKEGIRMLIRTSRWPPVREALRFLRRLSERERIWQDQKSCEQQKRDAFHHAASPE